MPQGKTEEQLTPRMLRRRCESYFARCDETDMLYGEAGLALHLGVDLETLRAWYDGRDRPELTEEVRRAYLRIQSQLESSPAYVGKGMVSKAVFLMKQPRLGGYQEKPEGTGELTVTVKLGRNMEESDFQ